MIFICLTPNPKGEHLKFIELGSPPLGDRGQGLFGADSITKTTNKAGNLIEKGIYFFSC
jgi:hypothetical protein